MGNEFQYQSVRSNKVIRLWWENYLLKAQTIATEQIISITELPFEAAKIPSLSCSLRNGGSASAPKGSEQSFSSWWSHWASGMAEEQVQHCTLPFDFPPWHAHSHCGEECKDQPQGFSPVLLGSDWSVLLCKAQPETVPNRGTGASTMRGKLFFHSLPAGTVVAGPGGHVQSRFVSTTPALITQVCYSPCVQT